MKIKIRTNSGLRMFGPVRWEDSRGEWRYAFGLWLWTLHFGGGRWQRVTQPAAAASVCASFSAPSARTARRAMMDAPEKVSE